MKNYSILASLVVIGFLGIAGFAPKGSEPKGSGPATGYKPGDVAQDFSLKNVDGKMFSLADKAEAKGFIVVFTCNHCPFSKMYETRIQALDMLFAGQGYPVVAINPTDPAAYPDDTFDKMVSIAREHAYTFPYLDDETQVITRWYGATNTPHAFVLNKEGGKLVVRYVGAIDDNAQDEQKAQKHYVAEAVNSLLAGKPVTTPKTKAIGCGIKINGC
jgi:peroxiredoxin